LRAIVTNDGVRERFYSLGIVPVGSTPEAFAADIKANIAKYRKLIATLGIKVE
jgi:tripartite-type tricarboxylate transporter receptor subunit TctC